MSEPLPNSESRGDHVPGARRIVPLLFTGLICGALTGAFILGVCGRLLMRAIGLAAGMATGFSLGGTLDVVIFGTLLGAGIGLASALIVWKVPGNPMWKGMAVGIAAYLLLIIVPFESKGAALAFPDLLWMIVAWFGLLFIVHGALVMSLIQRIPRETARRG